MRTIIDLPDEQLERLDVLCRRDGISRAEAVRRAIAAHVRQARAEGPDSALGLWRGRGVDGLAYERGLRAEWPTAWRTSGGERSRKKGRR